MPSRIWNKGRKDCFQLKLEIVILANNVYPDLLSYMILCPSAKRASMKRKVSLLKLLILIYLLWQHNRHPLKDQVVFQCLLKTAGSCFPGPFKHVLVPVNASINKTTPWLVSTRQKDKLQKQIMNNYALLFLSRFCDAHILNTSYIEIDRDKSLFHERMFNFVWITIWKGFNEGNCQCYTLVHETRWGFLELFLGRCY